MIEAGHSLGFFICLYLRKATFMKYFIARLFLFSLFTVGTLFAQESTLNTEKLKAFDAFVLQEIEANNIAGAEVYIVQNEQTVWHSAQGNKNMQTQAALEKNSIYYIQSMTKPIISTAIMQLVEQGKLSLNDKVEKYIPEVAQLRVTTDPEQGMNGPTTAREGDITLKQLLTHTAGFSHGLGSSKLDQELFAALYNETLDYKGHENLESRVMALLKAPLIGQPGQQWVYSASPDLLALILQRVSKQSIPAYLQEHLFDPIGMVDTGYNLTETQAERVMQLHTYDEEGKFGLSELQVPTKGNTVYGGTHGLFSTVKDYTKFCQVFLNEGKANGHQIITPETVALMRKNAVGSFLGESRGFGLGFGVLYNSEKDPSPAASGQFYWGGYFRTHFIVDPSEDIIAFFMTQKLPNGDDYNYALSRFVYGALEK